MHARHALVVAIAALLIVPGIAAASPAQGHPNLSATFADNRVKPGEETTLSVKLVNDGVVESAPVTSAYSGLQSRVTTARGVSVTMGDQGAPIVVDTDTQTLGSLADGTSAAFDFDVSVKDSAKPGTYEVPVYVEYTYTDYISTATGSGGGTHEHTTKNVTMDLKLRVLDDARFQVVDVDSNARVGATGTVTLEMKNTGTDPGSATRVTLTSKNGDLTFGQSASATHYVGEWDRGETKRVKFRVHTADAAGSQRYAFDAATTFQDDQGETKTGETLPVGVRVQREQEFSVVGTDSTVRVDDTGTLNVTLRNEGPISARDTTVTLTSNNADITFGQSSSATRYIGEWDPGTTKSIQVETTASGDAEPNDYALTATVSYEDGEGDAESSGSLSLGLRPEPERRFAASDVTSNFQVGEKGTLTGTITNEGDTTANNVVVRFDTDNQNVNPLSTESAVGNLAPGESAQFSFDVEISESAEAGTKQFVMHPEYRNSDNEARIGDDIVTRQRVRPQTDVFALRTHNTTFERGSSNVFTIDVTNAGNETVSDISAEMFADDPISVDDSEAFIKELKPGETETVTFKISASGSAVAKSYPVSVDFQYDNSDGDTLLSDTYRLPVTITDGTSGSGGPPVLPIVVVAVVVIASGGYYWYTRRRS
ncbi:MAG: COG1361 S-layer family protein [Haloarculaceae archaeon]